MTPQPGNISDYCVTTETQRLFVLIYGQPVTGKSTGARTFPDPYVIDVENNLPGNVSNVVPLWSDAFVDKFQPRKNPAFPADRRMLLATKIMPDFARKLTNKQTLVLDSLTRLETWYNLQEEAEPKPLGRDNKVDGNALWRQRLVYFDNLLTTLSGSQCNVVFTSHLQFERDEKREVTQYVRPALMGQIGEKLPGYFPICLQAVRDHIDLNTGKANPNAPLVYAWRIKASVFAPARVPKLTDREYIKQDYNELMKYV